MARKKPVETSVEVEAKKDPKYKVLVNFTERGKTRGYVVGEEFPRAGDNIGPEAMKRLLGSNQYGVKYIEEV